MGADHLRDNAIVAAKNLQAVNRHVEALERLYDLLRTTPSDVDALRLIARSQTELGQINEALTTLKKAAAFAPENFFLLNELGFVYFQHQAYERAEEAFSLALAINPNFTTAMVNLSSVYFQQKRYSLGKRTALSAQRLSPNSTLAFRLIALCSSRMNLFRDAREAALEALRLDPADPHNHALLGQVFEDHGDHEEASILFRRALELAPGNAWTRVWEQHLSSCMMRSRRGLRISKQHSVNEYISAARLSMSRANYRGAIHCLTAAENYADASGNDLAEIARIYAALRAWKKAEKIFTQLRSSHSFSQKDDEVAALVFWKRGSYQQALDFALAGIEIEKSKILAAIEMGSLFRLRLGRKADIAAKRSINEGKASPMLFALYALLRLSNEPLLYMPALLYTASVLLRFGCELLTHHDFAFGYFFDLTIPAAYLELVAAALTIPLLALLLRATMI